MASYRNGSLQVRSYRPHIQRNPHILHSGWLERVDECEVNEDRCKTSNGVIRTGSHWLSQRTTIERAQNWRYRNDATMVPTRKNRYSRPYTLSLLAGGILRSWTWLECEYEVRWTHFQCYPRGTRSVGQLIFWFVLSILMPVGKGQNAIELRVQQPAPQNAHVLNFA